MGRPKEKETSRPLNLKPEDNSRRQLEQLAAKDRCSLTKMVEKLIRQEYSRRYGEGIAFSVARALIEETGPTDAPINKTVQRGERGERLKNLKLDS